MILNLLAKENPMEYGSTLSFVFICSAAFIGAFVDAIAGGGGLITVPAYLFAGFPPHLALGTNKLSATFGSLSSTLEFFRQGKIHFGLVKYIIPCTFLGAILGVNSVLLLDQDLLTPLVSVMILAVGIYTFFKKDLGLVNTYSLKSRLQIVMGMIFGFVIGFYDGFFGPGTGSFLLFIFIKFFGMDFVNAGGNTKILNFVSNITSLVVFALAGKINFTIGLTAGVFSLLGSMIGTRVAIRRGASFVKPIFLIMSFAVFVKLILDMTSR